MSVKFSRIIPHLIHRGVRYLTLDAGEAHMVPESVSIRGLKQLTLNGFDSDVQLERIFSHATCATLESLTINR